MWPGLEQQAVAQEVLWYSNKYQQILEVSESVGNQERRRILDDGDPEPTLTSTVN